METLKQFGKALTDKLKSAIDDGDIFRANEITANLMLGAVILMMMIISILCLVLNEIGLFTADKLVMRCAMATVVFIELPIMLLNKKYHGEAPWMRATLEWGLLAICSILASTMGHNVTLVMVIPVVLSVRYCDVNFTRKICLASVVLFILAEIFNAFFGIWNLNMIKVAPGTQLTVETTLRDAILDLGIASKSYLKSNIINGLLPKFLAFSVIGFSCIKISQHGREMTETQNDIAKKATRIETELTLANEIQAGMLPCIFPAFPEHGELELYASNTPAKEVGGDFYDYFKIDDDHVAIVMADVSGKGVGAALFMTISKIVIKNQITTLRSPALALTNANAQLCENNEADLFVTAWVGIYEISSETLTYTNAGHNPPIVHHKGEKCAYLTGINGLVLAGMDDTQYTESQVHLGRGDEIFLYTDGVTEATDRKYELYGEDRFLSCVEKNVEKNVQQQISEVGYDINLFVDGAEQFDDITMMAMRIAD